MSLKITCPGCGKSFQVADGVAGKRVKCPACAHVWEVAAPAIASAPPAAAAAPIQTQCPACHRGVEVPGTAEGKRVKCPACDHVWQAARPIVAEVLPEQSKGGGWFDELMNDEYPLEAVKAESKAATASSPFAVPAGAGDQRAQRPCPHCGQLIVTTASNCRFCGAAVVATAGRRRKKRNLTGGMIAVAVVTFIFGGFHLLGGLITLAASHVVASRPELAAKAPEAASALSSGAAVHLAFGVLAIVGGIGICMSASWGRILAYLYAILRLLANAVSLVMSWDKLREMPAVGWVIIAVQIGISLAYLYGIASVFGDRGRG